MFGGESEHALKGLMKYFDVRVVAGRLQMKMVVLLSKTIVSPLLVCGVEEARGVVPSLGEMSTLRLERR